MGETPALLLPARDMLLPARDRGDASPLSRGEVPEEEAPAKVASRGQATSSLVGPGTCVSQRMCVAGGPERRETGADSADM